jgi:hypothetical protein
MKKNLSLTAALLLTSLCLSAQGATYSGNGISTWDGAVGLGSLNLTDDGTTLNLTLTKGPGDLNDTLVIYVDSVAGGFSDTSGFTDTGDGARTAISGFDGSDRSTMTFVSGFQPDYAVAFQGGYASLFTLVNGGSFNWDGGTGQAGNSSPTFSLSFPLASIGVSAGQSFELFGTYIASSAWRGPEAIAGNDAGSDGYNPFTQTAFSTYTTVPEPSTLALLGAGLASLCCLRRRQ